MARTLARGIGALGCLLSVFSAPSVAEATITFQERTSEVFAATYPEPQDRKQTAGLGLWNETASVTGVCGDGDGYSASARTKQISEVLFSSDSATVRVEGEISASATGTCTQNGARGHGHFTTAVRFTVTEAPERYALSGRIGPQVANAYAELYDEGAKEHVFLRDGSDQTGEFSASGELQPGAYLLRFVHQSFSGQSIDTASNLDFRLGDTQPAPCKRVKTGNGYAGLVPEMKAALNRLYDELDAVGACYRFTIGKRSQEYQDNLRRRWHAIADKPRGDNRSASQIKKQLKRAGFAQAPTGYKAPDQQGLRVAKGGPAKRSRHTEGQAADLTVTFPTQKNLPKFQEAARKAGLCGPPASDAVHVELPYRRKDRAHPNRKLFRCHFPEGPAPG